MTLALPLLLFYGHCLGYLNAMLVCRLASPECRLYPQLHMQSVGQRTILQVFKVLTINNVHFVLPELPAVSCHDMYLPMNPLTSLTRFG